jgi:glyoxylase-like metal-dependent hydrolase (beta-lactamase superfamily II)/rhodanese-related sulfurtransferase
MTSSLSTLITGDELVGRLGDDGLFLLDVREPDEVADWSIPGVVNIPIDSLASRLDEVPAEGDVVVICARGARAERGRVVLEEHGRASRVLDGGMSGWASTYDTVAGDFAGARVIQVRRRGKGCLSYVVGAGERCAVIDPSLEIERYEEIARAHGWRVTYIVDTHLHADHVSGARALAQATGATLLLNPGDPFGFDFEPLVDGREMELAAGVNLAVSSVSVPGHTEGSTMYVLGDVAVFTGDTLFLDSVGRPDLAEQAEPFAHHLYASLHERVLPLSDDVMVFPAHYGPAIEVAEGAFVARALGELRGELAALTLSEDEFVAWALANVKDRPPNYQSIVLVNMGRESVTPETVELEVGPNRCAIG